MKIVVIGQNGQLAWELDRLKKDQVDIVCLSRKQVDITDKTALKETILHYAPQAVINASAYTAVDLAETEREQAFLINKIAVGNLAEVCLQLSLHLVHVSTDFVFGGNSGVPYLPNEPYVPLGVYGESKAEGEKLITKILPEQSCILRTSWVYSSHGNNFVKTMLRLMSEKSELGVISDQIGSPTYAKGLAKVCLTAVTNKVPGIHHWSDAGVASWYDFAVAIQELGLSHHLLDKAIPIKPISTKDYPTPAKRPSYSVLDKTSLTDAFPELSLIHWRVHLNEMLSELKTSK
ncbi:MAG: dTDP-4-dehydrorhamnose reductase [Methylococcaceae bacterium]|nr:dTDP-4-dehydrorhamnose reductase [Methylococcaceae bacterium]